LCKGQKILDFGTGSGVFALILQDIFRDLQIFGVDTTYDQSQKDPNFKDTRTQQVKIWAEFSKKYKIEFCHFDGLYLPYPDSSFDIITACAVIEHIDPKSVRIVLKELKRVLKPNCFLFILKLPRKLSYAEFFARLLGIGCHEILFSDEEAQKIFAENGFRIEKCWKSDMVFEFPGKITNRFYFLLKKANSFLELTPFNIFAHHNNYILRNIGDL